MNRKNKNKKFYFFSLKINNNKEDLIINSKD